MYLKCYGRDSWHPERRRPPVSSTDVPHLPCLTLPPNLIKPMAASQYRFCAMCRGGDRKTDNRAQGGMCPFMGWRWCQTEERKQPELWFTSVRVHGTSTHLEEMVEACYKQTDADGIGFYLTEYSETNMIMISHCSWRAAAAGMLIIAEAEVKEWQWVRWERAPPCGWWTKGGVWHRVSEISFKKPPVLSSHGEETLTLVPALSAAE